MEWKYVLLQYDYISNCQGTDDHYTTMALIHCPVNCSFNNIRSTLYNKRYHRFYHQIDIDSVEDITIEW